MPGELTVKSLAVAGVAALLLASLACQRSPSDVESITPAELATRVEQGTAPLILDVRTEEEYAGGHIPGAVNIPHAQLQDRLTEIPTTESAEIVVHCQGGGRADQAEQVLTEAGYTNLRDLQGHMQQWLQDGFPVEQGRHR